MTTLWSAADYVALTVAADQSGCVAADLLACMWFESGLDPANCNSIGACGLIQWTPAAYEISGFSSRSDIPLTVQGQLPHVAQYLNYWRQAKRISYQNAGDVYQAIFAPGFFPATSNSTVWYVAPSTNYQQNSPLDSGGKGYITRGDAVTKVANHTRDAGFQQALANLKAVTGRQDNPSFGAGITYIPGSGYTANVAPLASASVLPALVLAGSAFTYYWYRLRK